MNLTIKLTVLNNPLTPKMTKLLRALDGAGKQYVLKEMGRELLDITLGQFGADKPHRAAPWAPLSPKYQKRIKYFGPPKLILSGELSNSLTLEGVNQNAVVVTAHSRYAAAHQFGSGPIPPRPFFPVIDGEFTAYAEERIRQRGERAVITLTEM